MIIGEAFRRLFDGLTANVKNNQGVFSDKTVQYSYGDQTELNRWVDLMNKGGSAKYPLIWYVIQDYREDGQWLESTGGLIIFTSTNINMLNQERADDTYGGVIEPVWRKVENLLTYNDYFDFISSDGTRLNRYEIKDEPLYGVDVDKKMSEMSNDFKSTERKGSESITIDILDARFINFKYRIKPNCI